MTDTTLTFTVYGEPAPAGSKKAFPFKKQDGSLGVRVADANAKAKPWQAAVASAAVEAFRAAGLRRQCEGGHGDAVLFVGPLELHITFFRPRPKSHYGKKNLRPTAPLWPTTRPDATKLVRGVEDALTGVLWRDDAQIVRQVVRKEYGAPARAVVVVREYREQSVGQDDAVNSALAHAEVASETMRLAEECPPFGAKLPHDWPADSEIVSRGDE